MATTDGDTTVSMELTPREQAVIAQMRRSDRARTAIFKYAVKFA